MAVDLQTPFKIFGLQRSGTNLIEALLTRNFLAVSLEIGSEWKHGPLRRPDRSWQGIPCKFVMCVKNPYAWLHSCYRYFQRSYTSDDTVAPQFSANPSMSFEQFICTPCYEFESPVHRWSAAHGQWLAELPAARTAVVRHEDQLNDQLRVLAALEVQLGLERRNEELAAINRRVGVNARIHSTPMNVDYYLNRRYLKEYSALAMGWVAKHLNATVISRFGYEVETRG